MDSIPNDMKKVKDMGIFNIIWEFDLGDAVLDWDKFTIDDFCALMKVSSCQCSALCRPEPGRLALFFP